MRLFEVIEDPKRIAEVTEGLLGPKRKAMAT